MASPLRQILLRAVSPTNLKTAKLLSTSCSDISSSKLLTTNQQCPKIQNDKEVLVKNNSEIATFETGSSKCKITISEPECDELVNKRGRCLPFVNTPDRGGILQTGTFPKEYLNVLGKGTYGTVVKAMYKGNQIAVKVISNKNQHLSLLRERNALYLDHKNIVKTFKVVCEANTNYGVVIMEDCSDSRHLQAILDTRELNIKLADITSWCLDICRGLQYCHDNNILHLDIKPKNILVQGHKCKICDFGNSLNLNCMEQINYINQGTVGYTAPELFQNIIPDVSADIYSLGITMWQMESRHLPYKNLDSKDAIIYFVVKHNLRPNEVKIINSEYSDIYQQCWSGDKTLRPTLNDIVNGLKQISNCRQV